MKIQRAKAPCPCGSNHTLEQCCGLYIYKGQIPPTPEALMRSRYTANTRKAYKYLMQTWHPTSRPKNLGASSKLQWQRLEIIKTKTESPQGWVEFKAHHGDQQFLHEKSFFLHEQGQWWYVDGEISPCPKKCCQ